jgi:hypothetical protein
MVTSRLAKRRHSVLNVSSSRKKVPINGPGTKNNTDQDKYAALFRRSGCTGIKGGASSTTNPGIVLRRWLANSLQMGQIVLSSDALREHQCDRNYRTGAKHSAFRLSHDQPFAHPPSRADRGNGKPGRQQTVRWRACARYPSGENGLGCFDSIVPEIAFCRT